MKMLTGEKINHFDSIENNTVQAFKDLFLIDLDADSLATITIGNMTTGGLRELAIEEKGIITIVKKDLEDKSSVWSKKHGKYVKISREFTKGKV